MHFCMKEVLLPDVMLVVETTHSSQARKKFPGGVFKFSQFLPFAKKKFPKTRLMLYNDTLFDVTNDRI